MTAELVTPTDELTGLPLPLAPIEDFGSSPEWHHHYHPRRDPLLTSTVGGAAVRISRLQRYSYDLHHYGYHEFYKGPPLPVTPEEQFSAVVMSSAGYIPEFALDFQKDEPRIVRLSAAERHRLQISGEIRSGAVSVLRNFIRTYVLDSAIDVVDINELAVEEFLTTSDSHRRRELGHNLLGVITNKAAEPANEPYYRARKQGLIIEGLPSNAQKFAKILMGTTRGRHKIVNKLYKQLETQLLAA